MSDYKNLSKKLLEDEKITYQDYFDLLNDKNWYYNEYYKIRDEYFNWFSGAYWFSIVCSLLVISVVANFVLYFSNCS